MRDKLDGAIYFEFRPGISQFPGWQGVQFDSDPGSIPGNALALGINVRFVPGGGVRPRFGIEKVADFPHYSPIDTWNGGTGSYPELVEWLGMHHMQFHSPRLWAGNQTCYQMGEAATGAFLRWYNPDKSPPVQPAGNFVAEIDRMPTIGSYGGEMYFGDWAVLQKPNVVEAMRGMSVALYARQSYTEQVVGYPGFDCTAMQEFDGKLFMALNKPGVSSEVATWDGVSLTMGDKDTGTDPGQNFCVWRDGKLAMWRPMSGTMSIRDTSGTWTDVAVGGGGASANKYKNSMVEFRDSIYLANANAITEISDFNSPAATVRLTLPSASYEARAITALGDNLYFLYNYWTGATYQVWLGYYEPDRAGGTWGYETVQLDSTAQTGVTAYFSAYPTGATTLTTYRNRLYAGGGRGIVVTHALPVDPLTDWFEVLTNAGTMPVTVLRVN